MQSDQTPNQTTVNTSPQNQPTPPINIRPTAEDIKSGLKGGDTPLDFIKNNLKTVEPEIKPEAVIKEVEAKIEAQKPKEEVKIDTSDFNIDLTKKDEPTKEPVKTDDSLEFLDDTDTTEVNLKELRKKLNTTKKTLEEKSKELETTSTKLKEYEEGKVLPEIVHQKEAEIERLSYYEKLHSLKTSKEYKEAFVKPLNELGSKLAQIAKDYEVPEDVMHEAINITNRAELNRFLSDHFDDVGASEIKQIVSSMRELQNKAKEAESKPYEVLNKLQEEQKIIRENQRKESLARMSNKSKDAWGKSLAKIHEEGKAIELIHRESDPDFNERIVKPLRTAAASEYGKIIKALADAGLEDIPDNLAFALARMTQLAHASAIAIQSRDEVMQVNSDLENTLKRTNSMVRPPIGSNSGSSKPIEAVKPASLEDAANHLINTVMNRK